MYHVNIKKLKAKDILPVVKEYIDNGKRVRITVTGNSMYPFLRDSKDSVELIETEYQNIKLGDIVLVLQNDGTYILHRLIKKRENYFYINGDAQWYREGPMHPGQIIGKVARVWRKEKEIKCNAPLWRSLSFLWFLLIPFRRLLIRYFALLRRIKKTVRSSWK